MIVRRKWAGYAQTTVFHELSFSPPWCLSRCRALCQDLRRHFPAKFRRALSLDEIKPEDTVHHGPFSGLLTRLGLGAPSPPSARSQPTFLSPRRSHRENTSNRSSRDYGSFDAERSLSSGSGVNEAQDGQRYSERSRRALSIPTPRRPYRQARPATSSDRGRPMGLPAQGGRKALGR